MSKQVFSVEEWHGMPDYGWNRHKSSKWVVTQTPIIKEGKWTAIFHVFVGIENMLDDEIDSKKSRQHARNVRVESDINSNYYSFELCGYIFQK